MTSNLPAWTALDSGALPMPSEPPGGPGRVVTVVVSDGALEAGWAGACAVALARGWAGAGYRVVLAYGAVTTPTLHHEVDLANGEGLTDVLLWGASVRRVARGIRDGGFYLITVGTVVADPAEVMEAPRWAALCEGFRDAGVTLAVFVPESSPGRDAVLARATDVVIVARADDDVSSAVNGVSAPVLAVLGRADEGTGADESVEVGAAEAPSESGSGDVFTAGLVLGEPVEDARVAPDEAPAGDGGDDVGGLDAEEAEAVAEAGAVGTAPEAELVDPLALVDPLSPLMPEAGEGGAPRVPPLEEVLRGAVRTPARPAGRRRVLLLVLLLVLVGVVAAALLGYVHVPGIPPLLGKPAAVPAPGAAVAPIAELPKEVTPPAVFDVALGAYQDEVVARNRVSRLRDMVPGVIFTSVPVDVKGVTFRRVLAGPTADSTSAVALAGRIAQTTGLDPSSWVIRAGPRAFLLGETPDRDGALRRVEVLEGLDVPAYVLAVDYSDGSVRYRVYAGAFADEVEASFLSALLKERGLDGATLSVRIGRLPE
jgi:SPOR domain